MSANIYWVPVSKKNRSLSVLAPSQFIAAIERAFGGLPREFSVADIPILRGMEATFNGDDNPYEQLIDAIETHERVRMWAEY